MKREDHAKITEMILGETFDAVHEQMDKPSKLLGNKHRVLFHDRDTIIMQGLLHGPRAAAAAALHIATDHASLNTKLVLLYLISRR